MIARWIAAFVLLLASASGARADAWNAQDARHAQALKAFVSDTALFPRLSNGSVAGSVAEPADLVRYLKRRGVEIDPDGAALLLTQATLKLRGRRPSDISAAALVTAYRPGSMGRHGDFAELDYVKKHPGSASWSTAGSQTTDVTFRGLDGEVTGYGQLKCKSTAMGSAHGVVENFVKSKSSEWPGKSTREFTGLIPRDQFDELVERGVLNADGTMKPAEFDRSVAQIDRTLEAGGYGARNRERLVAGRKALGGSAGDAARLRFEPLPSTYSEYRRMSEDFDLRIAFRVGSATPSSLLRTPLSQAPPRVTGSRFGAVFGVVGGLAGLGGVRFSQGAPRAALEGLDAAASLAAESGDLYGGAQKRSLAKMMQRLPKGMRASLPKVGSVRQIAKFAGRAAGAVAVLFVAWETYQFATGQISTRDFQSSLAGMGGGVLGGFGAGAAAGLIGGPFAWITVPAFGFVGGVVGGIAGSRVVDAWWNTSEEKELEYAIELIRRRFSTLPN